MLLAAGMVVTATAQNAELRSFSVGSDSFVNGMSTNGRWATYQKQAGEDSYPLEITLIDLTTGKTVSYTPKKLLNYRGMEGGMPEGSYSQPFGVSDDGKTVYGTVNGYPAYFTVDDLTWHCLSMGSVSDNRSLSGAVYGMSADGSRMAGWFSGEDMTKLRSALWENGEIRELNNLPTYKDMFDKGIINKTDFISQQDQTPNFTFRTLSEDGNTLLVGVDHNRPEWGCSYGVYDIPNEKFSFILADIKDYNNCAYTFTDGAAMSTNGEWVTGNMLFIGKDPNGFDDNEGVYRYHVPTGKLEVFTDMQSHDILATAIDNKGNILAGTPRSQPMRNFIVRSDNLWVDLSKILEQKYGINYTAKTGFDNSGYPVAVSSDCKTVLSQAEFRGGAFALTLPVDFAEAAKGTNLLTEYVVAPANGKKFSKLKEVMVRFSYGVVPVKDAKVVVKDENGNIIGNSSNITAFSSQNTLYTVKFPDIDMQADKKYTVTVPEGTFTVEGTTMGNPEINTTYTGRANTPVSATSISPEAESFINVFSFNSPVTIDFDSDLTLSSAVQAKLYEEGKSVALCNLSVTAEGQRLLVYPASERRLAKDRVYRVEIPAGIVYDLSGEGANTAISLTYYGAYVPTPVEDSARPFFEDFNAPNEALYNFLMIDGDGLNPTEEMQGFGFDAVNTPWNFSIRDNDSSDYCAASHSKYSPAGQSDDWMVIPQLKLNDADYYLTFKAQSYAKNKTDKLKIVVWEYDEVLGSLDESILNKMKSESKVLAEIQLVPMRTEGVLNGSWIDYEFPLADFAGKNVYIGFVNENNNQSLVFVDDLAVEYRGAYTLSVATENSVINADKVNVTAFVNVNAPGPYKTLEATIAVPGMDYTDTVTLNDLNLTTGSKQNITFENVPLKAGEVNSFSVTTTLGDLPQTYSGRIINHAFEINRRVLVEEGTGMWCGNCPLGEVAIEHLETTMPDNVAIISVHNGDAITNTEYDQLLALGAYPNGRIDRSDKVVAPLNTDNGTVEYISEEGDKTFKDLVLSQLSEATEGEIKVVNPVYFAADGAVSIPVSVRFSVSRNNAIYNVFTCVVEDGLTGRQSNYFTGNTAELMQWWSAQPSKVSYTYNNVARAMIGGYYGMSGRVPTSVKAGDEYITTLLFELPANVTNPDNMHFVVALIDATTGRVINSDVCREYVVNNTPGDASGVEDITAEEIGVSVSVANGKILVNGNDNCEVYTTSGMRVRNENLATGIYIVRKQLSDGNVVSRKVMVK